MAHRKLQQEIDRVFKKINEGLEIFDTYYERHENCTNNPSQKDKLESDLKREVKKLQRLREQIKSWQSSPDIKDKDSLLDFRRSVEIAMEKYKAVEKASKEKAYSNISLKKSDNMDPQEKERRDVSEYLSNTIDELERQYEGLQVEIDKLIILNKKKKTASQANEEKKDQLKNLQMRYRWHQQQMELALRLLANEELNPDHVKEIQEDINYYVESNQEPDFVEDETIYDTLDLQSNEAIAHEVAQYFASQQAEDNNGDDDSASKDASKTSKKELRRLEREAKKAAKAASKGSESDSFVIPNSYSASISAKEPETLELLQSQSPSPSPGPQTADSSKTGSTPSTVPNTAKSPNGSSLTSLKHGLSATSHSTTNELLAGHTHIHQTLNGITTTSTLKPATVPARPAGEIKWAVAASQGIEKDKKMINASSNTNTSAPATSGTNSAAGLSNVSTRSNSATNTPRLSTPSLETTSLAEHLEKSSGLTNPNASTSLTAAAVLAAGAAAVNMNNKAIHKNASPYRPPETLHNRDEHYSLNTTPSLQKRVEDEPELIDDYESEWTDDELEEEPVPEQLTELESETRKLATEQFRKESIKDYEMLLLPGGIQEFIMGVELFNRGLEPLDGKLGGYRRSHDACTIPRFGGVPLGVNPPAPLDAFRSTQQWDVTRCSLRSVVRSSDLTEAEKYQAILERFRSLEMFTLFYNYYFAVTPLEQHIASIILAERHWKVSKSSTLWFLRQGDAKFTNGICEVADYKVFKLDDWTVADKLNFKLDYAFLKEPPVIPTVEKESMVETDGSDVLSHGQQLLQQLKQGKVGTSA